MTERLTLERFWEVAAGVSGLPSSSLERISNDDLIDSALHAPFAGFGGEDKYPELHEKVGVLGYRLIKNHGLPDRNKRTAIAAMDEFARLNSHTLGFEMQEMYDMTTRAAASEVSESEFVNFVERSLKILL